VASQAPAQPAAPVADDVSPPNYLRFRIAFFLVAAIILGLVVSVPFAVNSLLDDMLNSVEGQIFTLVGTRSNGVETARNQVHIGISDLDESRLRATLRISAHRVCPNGCPAGNRVVLFAVGANETETAGMPPSGTIDLPAGQSLASQTIELPMHGHPTLYPFDTYELWLGTGLAELDAHKLERPLTREQANGLLAVTLNERLPRERMDEPIPMPISRHEEIDAPFELQSLTLLRFSRPIHEKALAVLLVILIAAAAAYAVFMRPLHDLVINCGGLVLGVWGIRSLLTPGTASRTLVDISLSIVILFLLSAITFRALQFLYERSGFTKTPPGGEAAS
jgi:hypothetical protein